jgi:hypothetical protein
LNALVGHRVRNCCDGEWELEAARMRKRPSISATAAELLRRRKFADDRNPAVATMDMEEPVGVDRDDQLIVAGAFDALRRMCVHQEGDA